MKKDVKFEDAQKQKQEHPESFYAPGLDELKQIKPGETVKVCAYNERFWVQVTAVDGDTIKGRVDNDLLTRRLKFNDIVTFKFHNVYNIWSIEARGLEQLKKEWSTESFSKTDGRGKKPARSKGKGFS